jgi:excisionase family DNA binding protein
MQAREHKRLYSIEDAAEYLSLSATQVYRLAVSGKLPSLREGRRRLIDRDALDAWIANRKQVD